MKKTEVNKSIRKMSVEEINAFAEKFNLKVTVKEKETSEYPAGTVISQSRTGKIVNGATITITVAKEPTKKEETDTGKAENTETNTETNTEKDTNSTQ